jgi:putative addiction module killer protein
MVLSVRRAGPRTSDSHAEGTRCSGRDDAQWLAGSTRRSSVRPKRPLAPKWHLSYKSDVPTEVELRVYTGSDGREPFTEWLRGLRDRATRGRIRQRIARIRLGNLGDARSVGEGVHELRIHLGPGYRIYFGREGDAVVILLCGGDKGSQDRDIQRAHEYWHDHRSRLHA